MKALRAGPREPARVGNHSQANEANDERARTSDELGRLCWKGKPLKGGTLDVAAGRNKPARPEADEIVEGVRNAEDERRRAWKLAVTTLRVEVAKRATQPQGRSFGRETGADTKRLGL